MVGHRGFFRYAGHIDGLLCVLCLGNSRIIDLKATKARLLALQSSVYVSNSRHERFVHEIFG